MLDVWIDAYAVCYLGFEELTPFSLIPFHVVSQKKDAADGEKKEATAAAAKPAAAAAAKPKKAPAKPLPEMMQEEIIPPLKDALEAEENVSQVQLSFQNNTVSTDCDCNTECL